jgi:hypothetical protein
LCDPVEAGAEIPGFVQQIEEMDRDEPVARVAEVGSDLL